MKIKLKSEEKFDRHLDTVIIGRHVCFGGGGGQGPTTNQTNTSNVPEYLRPYVERQVAASEALAGQGYQQYGGQQIAGFNQNQLQTQANTMGMQTPGQFGAANRLVGGQNVAGAFNPAQSSLSNMNTQGAFNPAQSSLSNMNTQGAFNPAQSSLSNMNTQGAFNPALQGTASAANRSWTDPGVAQQYMNPYQQNVTDIAKREAALQSDIQGVASDAQFAKAGAFGGSRQGIMDAARQRGLAQQMNDIQTKGSNEAYQQGMGQFSSEAGRQLQGAGQYGSLAGQQLSAEQARAMDMGSLAGQQLSAEQARAMGMGSLAGQQLSAEQARAMDMGSLAGQRLGAEQAQAQTLAGLGAQQQGLDLTRLGAQGQVGAQQQGLTQQQQDLAYANFVNQRDYGKQQAGWMSGMLHGTPTASDSTVRQYQAPPNIMSQVAGLGIAGLGAYGASQKGP